MTNLGALRIGTQVESTCVPRGSVSILDGVESRRRKESVVSLRVRYCPEFEAFMSVQRAASAPLSRPWDSLFTLTYACALVFLSIRCVFDSGGTVSTIGARRTRGASRLPRHFSD